MFNLSDIFHLTLLKYSINMYDIYIYIYICSEMLMLLNLLHALACFEDSF